MVKGFLVFSKVHALDDARDLRENYCVPKIDDFSEDLATKGISLGGFSY